MVPIFYKNSENMNLHTTTIFFEKKHRNSPKSKSRIWLSNGKYSYLYANIQNMYHNDA
jgi:hypothetical protein